MYLLRSNQLLKWVFPGVVWNGSRTNKEIFLTFDDGPTPGVTPAVLDILKKYDARATFFLLGKNVEQHPEIVDRIIEEGHSIGNHTYSHVNGWRTPVMEYLKDVQKGAALIDSKLFRPPYGRIGRKQLSALKQLGYKIIMWEVLSADFDTKLKATDCVKNVCKNVRPGSIVVFHDSVKAWPRLEECLPQTLEYLKNAELKLEVLTDQLVSDF